MVETEEQFPDHVTDNEQQKIHKERCAKFNVWCKQSGILAPKLEYPAYFEGGLIGVKVTEDIQHRECFLAVPYSKMITTTSVQAHPVLGPIISQHKKVFGQGQRNWEQNMIVLQLLYEKQKGQESEWAPWLDIVPKVDYFYYAPETTIKAAHNKEIQCVCKLYNRETNKTWLAFSQMLESHKSVFHNERYRSKEEYFIASAQVDTRTFGWGLPFLAFVPLADMFNHSDCDIVQRQVNIPLHTSAEGQNPNSSYFESTKFMNNYYQIIPDSSVQDKFFDREKFTKNTDLWNLAHFEAEAQKKAIWEIEYLRDEQREDNDTEEEDGKVSGRFATEVKQCINKGKKLRKIENADEFKYFLKEALSQQPENSHSLEELDREECGFKKGKLVSGHNKDLCESFTWYSREVDDVTYFCMVNTARRTFRKGEQQWYHYGRRNNKYLLIHYGFCFENNKYDSFEFEVGLEFVLKKVKLEKILEMSEDGIKMRLKRNQMNQELLSYLRYVLQPSFGFNVGANFSKPSNRAFERTVLDWYSQLVERLLELQKSTIQKDIQEMAEVTDWQHKMAILYRLEQKRILANQLQLVQLFKKLVETTDEDEARDLIFENMDKEDSGDVFWYRRLYNSEYIRDICQLDELGL